MDLDRSCLDLMIRLLELRSPQLQQADHLHHDKQKVKAGFQRSRRISSHFSPNSSLIGRAFGRFSLVRSSLGTDGVEFRTSDSGVNGSGSRSWGTECLVSCCFVSILVVSCFAVTFRYVVLFFVVLRRLIPIACCIRS